MAKNLVEMLVLTNIKLKRVNIICLYMHFTSLSLTGLAKAEVLSYIVPGMQVATDYLNVEVAPV